MQYEQSLGAFFLGIIILIIGILFTRFHQAIANNFGHGVASYDRYKLYAIATCGLGLFIMTNLHTTLLEWFFGMLFSR